jgi:Pyruvate/2-oxoacid:ferredoxin oxidoreductase gamma subunit
VEKSAVVGADPDREPGTVTAPFIATARALGSNGVVAANVVALGALVALSNVVSEASLRRALRQRVKPALRELNERALEAGLRLCPPTALPSQAVEDLPLARRVLG